MKLSVKERLLLQTILPQKGNLIEQTIVRDILEKTKLTQQEFI